MVFSNSMHTYKNYVFCGQFAFVPEQTTVVVSVATSDLLMFHFDINPANTVQWIESKWGRGSPDPGIKAAMYGARPARLPCLKRTPCCNPKQYPCLSKSKVLIMFLKATAASQPHLIAKEISLLPGVARQ